VEAVVRGSLEWEPGLLEMLLLEPKGPLEETPGRIKDTGTKKKEVEEP